VSLAASRRSAGKSEDARGCELNTGYDQYNAQLVWDFELAGQQLALQTLYSEGRDIGKSNNQYPAERITDYPDERHWLGELVSTLPWGASGSLFYHYQELDTRVERPGERINAVADQALDLGLRLTSGWRGQSVPVRFGLDYLGRRDVEARERELDLETGQSTRRQTLDARQDNLDIYADAYRQFASLELAAGLRWAHADQQARGFADTDDSAISAFMRTSWEATPALNVSLELASGVRFAGLSERYFSGTTGRGQVLGNPSLDPEDTLGVDLGLQWRGASVEWELRLYALEIDNYIERVDLSEELRSFRNVTQGDIHGLEGVARWSLGQGWSLSMGAHYISGEDRRGTPLANIAAPRASAALHYELGDWQAAVEFDYRFSESDVAPGELPADSAKILQASIGKSLSRGFRLRLWGRNLLDDSWRLTTDNLTTLGPERSVGIALIWQDPR
jgi:iron complex outermembrane receptor protein